MFLVADGSYNLANGESCESKIESSKKQFQSSCKDRALIRAKVSLDMVGEDGLNL